VDLDALRNLTQLEFEALAPDGRLYMDWKDQQHTRRYRALWVTPIYRGPEASRRVGGVLSIDVIDEENAAEKLERAAIDNPRLDPIMAFCHAVLPRH
jgi:hypothetical protein